MREGMNISTAHGSGPTVRVVIVLNFLLNLDRHIDLVRQLCRINELGIHFPKIHAAQVKLLELGDPEFSGSIILGLDFGVPRLTYNMRYIGEQFVNTFETFNPLQGRPAENPDYSFPSIYPETFYHNFRLDLEAQEGYAFYVGVDNLLDTIPPLGLDATTAGSGIYDNIGRLFYAGARFNF